LFTCAGQAGATANGNARALRREMTGPEGKVWYLLRGRRLADARFRRQHPIGPFIADFACVERRLVVELDGGQHDARAGYDARRTAWLQAQGWRVIRFWNNQVVETPDEVVDAIRRALDDDGHLAGGSGRGRRAQRDG
jgi:very-short-patch-repair endonuclease